MRKLLFASIVAGCSATATAQAWLDASQPLRQQIERAKREGVRAAETTRVLVTAGADTAQVVQSVALVYGSCEALNDSVREAVGAVPQDARAVIEAVAALPGCPCTADTVWPQIRLESRLRVESRRMGMNFAPSSMCLAAAADTAIQEAPTQADEVLRAAIAAGRKSGTTVDSVGQAGAAPPAIPAQANWKRDAEREETCVADLKITDEFRPEDRFVSAADGAEVVARVERRCERARDLLIDGVATARSANTAVVLRNDTGSLIDLEGGGYALKVYPAGADLPARIVALEGTINPDSTYIVASEDADPRIRAAANLVTRSVRIGPGDAIELVRNAQVDDCRGVPTAIAVIANALGDQGTAWLRKTSDEYSADGRALKVVDAMGQVGQRPEAWEGPLAGRSFTARRERDLCAGDTDPADGFALQGGWRGVEGVEANALGQAGGKCAARSADLVITEYQNDAERFRAVEILNNTSGDVDLGGKGYVLEVYGQGAAEPTRTIALSGRVKVGQSYVIADEDAPAEVRERAQMVTDELGVDRINALVLRRVTTVTGRACAAEVIAATRDIGPVPVLMVLANPIVPSREPRNDDPTLDRNRGGQLASPN